MKRKQLLTLAVATVIAGISLVWVTTARSSYIHDKTVNWVNTISICDPDSNGTKCITTIDKNLWATINWSHYQWWNNHWFKPCSFNYCTGFPWWEIVQVNSRINTDGYWPWKYFSGSIFRRMTNSPYDWSSPGNDNLWWWWDDNTWNNWWLDLNNSEDRWWPCATWYHVPSVWEWWTLLEYRAWNYTWVTLYWTAPWYSFSDSTAVTQFIDDFRINFAGYRNYSDLKLYSKGDQAYYWTSSPNNNSDKAYYFSVLSNLQVKTNQSFSRLFGASLRCFKDIPLTFQTYVTPVNDENFLVTLWEEIYYELPEIMEITINNDVEIEESESVVWEISLDFWDDVTAKFNKLVLINIPVEDEEQVIVKVKHAWSSEYNYDWLTTNANASCNANWRPTSSQYNWETINVVDWYATIYTCEASSFIALWLREWEALGEVTLTLTAWENTYTLNDYNLGTHNVSSEDQNVSTSWQNIVCEFLKNPWATIQLSMWDLVDGTKEIWRQNFTWIVTSLWNSLWTIANLTWWSYNFSWSHIIYTKQANTIWTWTWSLAIEWIILAWTPGGQYTWELNVIICEGC